MARIFFSILKSSQLQIYKMRQVFWASTESGQELGKDGLRASATHSRICQMVRIRKNSRRKRAAVAAIARDIDFRYLWRKLTAAGWKAKKPTGLMSEWTYSNPDGTHSFVGEGMWFVLL